MQCEIQQWSKFLVSFDDPDMLYLWPVIMCVLIITMFSISTDMLPLIFVVNYSNIVKSNCTMFKTDYILIVNYIIWEKKPGQKNTSYEFPGKVK